VQRVEESDECWYFPSLEVTRSERHFSRNHKEKTLKFTKFLAILAVSNTYSPTTFESTLQTLRISDVQDTWWMARKKQDAPDEDAELRDLVNAYAQLHNSNDPSQPAKPPVSTTKSTPEPSKPQTSSQQSSKDDLPGLPMDEVIRGSSISYTRAEAKMYANEEPCDTWRHLDVFPLIFQL
jgi:hypothetical protein